MFVDAKLYFDPTEYPYGVSIGVGDKLMAFDGKRKSDCEKLNQELIKLGFKTRMAKGCETKEWTIAILEIPKVERIDIPRYPITGYWEVD